MAARGLEICLAVFRSIPVVFITAIIVWSYYAYVVQMCIFAMDRIPQQVIYILLYHPILVMFCWSYWKTIFTPVGTPAPEFYLFDSQLEQFELATDRADKNEVLNQAARDLPVYCRTNGEEMRYCVPCKLIKPDRAHHCSICGKCILKMDHHCPWVNNCVGYSNYKFFVLFLFYGLLYTIYVGGTSLQFFIIFWSGIGSSGSTDLSNLHIVFVFFAAVMFAISLASLLGYHCFLLARNRTTLEALHSPYFVGGPDKNGFNLGCRANFLEVFGMRRLDWFLPKSTSLGTGMSFSTRASLLAVSTYHTMDSTISMSQTAIVSNGDAAAAETEYHVDEAGLSTSKLIGPDQEDQWPNSVDSPPV